LQDPPKFTQIGIFSSKKCTIWQPCFPRQELFFGAIVSAAAPVPSFNAIFVSENVSENVSIPVFLSFSSSFVGRSPNRRMPKCRSTQTKMSDCRISFFRIVAMGERGFDFLMVSMPRDRDANWRPDVNYKIYTF
jgi:hypothetical protein